ncbi:MAG: TonB-dependent receptor [Bacteroidales bacterium]|nr:TonB-dependent receptor [Bacteroidales bacterium]
MYKRLLTFVFISFLFGQLYAQVTITGQVKDNYGEPMPGVNVMVKGTTQGTITDLEGNYSLSEVASDAVLIFTFVGMLSQEIAVGDQTTINVDMAEDVLGLDEVVVIGYGTVKKRDLTGSVSSVKANDIVKAPTSNVLEAIQGRVPGMDITRSSGSAGAGVNITLRGNRSLGDIGTDDPERFRELNEPLVIIDGMQGGSISDLNANDIESIEVLKDASSTAIYGFQGANGVIIVTTKKGKEGSPKVSYNMFYGINGLTPYPKVRIGDDYIQLRRDAARNGSLDWNDTLTGSDELLVLFPDFTEYQAVDTGNWVNWPDLLIKNGKQVSHQLSISSGTEKTQSYLSVGYFKEEGILKLDDMTRYNARLNLDHTMYKWASAGLSTQITYTDRNYRKDPLSKANSLVPLGKPFNDDGTINEDPLGTGSLNPLTDERPNVSIDNSIQTRILTKGYFELRPIEGLSLRTNLGVNLDFQRRGKYYDGSSLSQTASTQSLSSITSYNTRYYNWDNIASFTKEIGIHSFTVTALSSYVHSVYDDVSASGANQPNASALYYQLNSTEDVSINSSYEGYKTFSYAGRLNYSLMGRYLITMTGRHDGASMLSSGHKSDDFPSVAVAWIASEESFMKGFEALSNLKIRLSRGTAGNSNIAPYSTQSGIEAFQTSFGEEAVIGYRFLDLIGNAEVGWEKSKTTDLGFDIGFFKNRVSATVDVYKTKTTDILQARKLPTIAGVDRVYQNIGATENQGIELALNTYNIQTKDFKWSTVITYARNVGRIVDLIDDQDIISGIDNSLFIGQPIQTYYMYNKLGIWQEDEADMAAAASSAGITFEPGSIKLEDLNHDGIIDANDKACFYRDPDWFGAMQNTFTYKFIDLSVDVQARYGQYIEAEFLGRYDPSGRSNGPANIDYWTPDNPTNDYPQPHWNEQINSYYGYESLRFVNGSYFKVKNITLAFTVPQKFTQRILIERFRIYGTLSNILTVTKNPLIKDYDPERGGSEKAPLSKQLVFGVNVDF